MKEDSPLERVRHPWLVHHLSGKPYKTELQRLVRRDTSRSLLAAEILKLVHRELELIESGARTVARSKEIVENEVQWLNWVTKFGWDDEYAAP